MNRVLGSFSLGFAAAMFADGLKIPVWSVGGAAAIGVLVAYGAFYLSQPQDRGKR